MARSTLRRRLVRVLLIGLLLPAALVGTLGILATCRPAGYVPRSIDYDRLDDDKRAAFALLDQISAALNAGREIRVTLDEQQLNRWITARAEIWPDETALELPGVERPVVALRSGSIGLTTQLSLPEWRGFVAVWVGAEAQPDSVALSIQALRIGRLPIPRSLLELIPANARQRHPLLDSLAHEGRVRLPNEFVWRNGRRPFRILDLSVENGRLSATLAPR